MGFIDFIEKLQNKPRHVRVRILWLGVILSMIIIGGIWIVSLSHSLKIVSSVEGLEQTEVKEEFSFPSLFSIIKDEFSSLKENLKAGFEEIMKSDEQKELKENYEEEQEEYKRVRLPVDQ